MDRPTTVPPDCWRKIGVWGDRTCPELAGVHHCHNCGVFAGAGRGLLDRPAPPGYLDAWHERLVRAEETTPAGQQAVLVFRLGGEWLALPMACLREAIDPRPVHRVPHRSDGVLLGVVNVDGELCVCVSLAALLDVAPAAAGGAPASRVWSRLLVAEHEGHGWVFPVDEVRGLQRVGAAALSRPPVTIEKGTPCWVEHVFALGEDRVGLLDHALLFQRLRELRR